MFDAIVACYGVTLHRDDFTTLPTRKCLLAWSSAHNSVMLSNPHQTSPYKPHPAILIDPSTSTYDRFFYPIEIAYGAYSHCHSFPVHAHKFNWHFTPSMLSLKGNSKLNNMQAFHTYPPPWHTPAPTGLEHMTEILKGNSQHGFYFKGGYIEKYLGKALCVPTYDLAQPKFTRFKHGQPWTDAARTPCTYHTAYHDISCPIVRVKATQNFLNYRNLPKPVINSIITQYQQARLTTPINHFPPFTPSYP